MTRSRLILASASVAIIAVVFASATAVGPDDARVWLVLCGIVTLIVTVQSVTSDPNDLTPALLLSLPPVITLVADGSPTWLIGPFAALLLLAGELNALSWQCQVAGPLSATKRRRLRMSGQLAWLALAVSLALGLVAPRL